MQGLRWQGVGRVHGMTASACREPPRLERPLTVPCTCSAYLAVVSRGSAVESALLNEEHALTSVALELLGNSEDNRTMSHGAIALVTSSFYDQQIRSGEF